MSAGWIALFVALWLVVLLLVVLMLGLVRKVAALEAAQVPGDRKSSQVGGPPVGTPAPPVAAHQAVLTSTPDIGHGRVVLFLSSSCGACRRLAGELRTEDRAAAASDRPARDFELVVVTDPNGRDIYTDLDVDAVVVQIGGEMTRAWSVPGTPFAVAVDDNGMVRASAFASTRAKLHELGRAVAANIGPPAADEAGG